MRISGKGGGKGLSLLVIGSDKAVAKDAEGKPVRQYLDIQRDLRDPAGASEPHPHAATYTDKNGKTSNGVGYSPRQVEKMIDVMKESGNYRYNEERTRFEGTMVADVFVSNKIGPKDNQTEGLVVNTASPLKASEYNVDENTVDNQYAAAKVNREAAAKAKAAKEAPAPEAETPETKADAPEAKAEAAETKPAAKKAPAKSTTTKKAAAPKAAASKVKTSTSKAAKAAEGTETEKDQPDVG